MAAGSSRLTTRTAKSGQRSSSRRHWAPRPCCWVGGAMSISQRGWSSRPGEWADRLRSLPKYVVSSTPLVGPDWKNATVLKGDVVNEISKLKQELDGEIVVYGSRQLVRTLMDHDLIDELRLTVYPVVLGSGDRLFDELADKTPLRLAKATTIGDGFAFVSYEVVRNA